MFQGSSALAIDAKGRMTVPARHRDALAVQCEGRLTLTRHPDGCLLMFPRPAWEAVREKIAALPISASGWRRFFLGNAADVEMDSADRVLIPPELRKAVGLAKDVMLLGMGTHFEIWDAALLAAKESEAIAGGMPEALSGLSL
ncbi:MAG TPA: division/cell wall cluster transcriptional repressor MraZ [Burkholderiaceae bacterium]|jgi:MraZ protein|nr:division/cell wall cluster transcriptional repressor MraZ [Burkholderiaceae bacterium]